VNIGDRCREVLERVALAAARSGRKPEEITVVAAAKGFGPEAVRAAIDAGIRDVGENYVQEAQQKQTLLGREGIRWHLIGRLQRNKASRAVSLFDLVHTVDSVELARALDRAAGKLGRRVRCLVEVNLAGEPTKAGVSCEAVASLCQQVAALPGICLEGLMAIPPPGSPEESRRFFVQLREIRDRVERLRLPGVHLKELSMGMSADFEAAIEEGATLVRIGTAIFGRRFVG
jgi:hypothetical protein